MSIYVNLYVNSFTFDLKNIVNCENFQENLLSLYSSCQTTREKRENKIRSSHWLFQIVFIFKLYVLLKDILNDCNQGTRLQRLIIRCRISECSLKQVIIHLRLLCFTDTLQRMSYSKHDILSPPWCCNLQSDW